MVPGVSAFSEATGVTLTGIPELYRSPRVLGSGVDSQVFRYLQWSADGVERVRILSFR